MRRRGGISACSSARLVCSWPCSSCSSASSRRSRTLKCRPTVPKRNLKPDHQGCCDAKPPTPTLYGLMAEFDTPTALVEAATKARLAGYRKMDAYSPIPIHELDEALG